MGLLFKDNLKVSLKRSGEVSSFEFGVWSVTVSSINLTIVNIYRPPYSTNHPVPCSVFIKEFADFITDVFVDFTNVIILGDFNIHWDNKQDQDMLALKSLLTSLVQHADCITHNAGHTIDLIITKEEFAFSLSDPENVFPISDHGMIKFCIDITKPPTVTRVVEFRNLKMVDQEKLRVDLRTLVDKFVTPDYNASLLVADCTKALAGLLEQHAPLLRKRITDKRKPDWLTDELLRHS